MAKEKYCKDCKYSDGFEVNIYCSKVIEPAVIHNYTGTILSSRVRIGLNTLDYNKYGECVFYKRRSFFKRLLFDC